MNNPSTFRTRFLLLAALAATLTGCSDDKEQAASNVAPADSPVLAVVGGSPITAADLIAEAERRRARRQPPLAKEELLQSMVDRASLVYRAKSIGLEQDSEVSRAIDSLLVGELRQREFQEELQSVSVSEEEIRAAYAAEGDKLTSPAKSRLSILFLDAGGKESDAKKSEQRERMARARELAIAGPAPRGRGPAANGFGALAVEYSDDQVSRYRGGDAGWFELGRAGSRWPESVVQAGHALAVGELSEVIETASGFYLVIKTDTLQPETTDFEAASVSLRQRLLQEKREALENAFLEKSARFAEARIDTEALSRVEIPFSAVAAGEADELRPPTLPAAETN